MSIAEADVERGLRLGVVGVALLVAGAVLGAIVAGTDAPPLDRWWDTTVGSLAPGLVPVSLALDGIGGGWVGVLLVPAVITAALLAARRPWAAGFFVVASVVSALVVQVLKNVFGRARPEDMFVISDFGSFPSGHTANAATVAVVAIVLFSRLWVAVVGIAWTALMAFARTQVHAHWLTDTIGGVLVGTGAALLVAAVFAAPLRRRR
ncbi:phosphatase PAP2 family protein [Microbacterium sp. No. 7]|uniref:phosphatase PAP2 family protein n=1 Tax=Microbacterium sp. No. 7 TaxID=1714373 RepID=UPI0006D001EA|nr:phosphatase PAP2 family protein [Microbacterium sp. No. 7]ALJ21290.1 phospholipid phosphatase [Microbacterium sp. No. 7]